MKKMLSMELSESKFYVLHVKMVWLWFAKAVSVCPSVTLVDLLKREEVSNVNVGSFPLESPIPLLHDALICVGGG